MGAMEGWLCRIRARLHWVRLTRVKAAGSAGTSGEASDWRVGSRSVILGKRARMKGATLAYHETKAMSERAQTEWSPRPPRDWGTEVKRIRFLLQSSIFLGVT